MGKKVLVCIGDSWTDDNFNSSVYPDMDTNWPKWPKHLADMLDMEVLNLGTCGSGNQQIFNKAVDATNYADNIGGVVCMWSEPDRIDFEVHDPKKQWNGYNTITNSAFLHWSPRRSVGLKRQTHQPLLGIDEISTAVRRWNQNHMNNGSPSKFDPLAEEVLDLGIWQMETSWRQSLRYWYSFQSICENEKIPYLQIVGTNPFFTWLEEQDYKVERRKVIDHLMTTDYMLSINNETFVGWPIFGDIGGDTASSIIHNEKYRMGVNDSHPNESGHRYLAEYLYKEWNTKWA